MYVESKEVSDALTLVRESMKVATGKIPDTQGLLIVSLSQLFPGQYLDGGFAKVLLFL